MYLRRVFTLILLLNIFACTSNDSTYNTRGLLYQQHRPQFHFSPPSHWMNDPNGMVYNNDLFHLYYQYYPEDTKWGPMHWGHATSKDLVNWTHKPIAIYPDSTGYIFSGSVVIDSNNTSKFEGIQDQHMIALYTYGFEDDKMIPQRQGLAYSIDGGISWSKYNGNPVLDEDLRAFRDPKVFWHEASGNWIMTIVASSSNENIITDHVRFYSSKDLLNWKYKSDFGNPFGAQGANWECPDLFELEVDNSGTKKWVLLVSIGGLSPNGGTGIQYFIGDFDGTNFTLDEDFENATIHNQAYFEGEAAKTLWLDYGRDNYAGVSWNNVPKEDGRRLFIGWMSNWQYAQEVPTKEWRSAMTIPRELLLSKNTKGTFLKQIPINELEQLRGEKMSFKGSAIQEKNLTRDLNLKGKTFEVILDIEFQDNPTLDFGLKAANQNGEFYKIGFDASKNCYYSDRRKSGKTSFNPKFAEGIHYAPRMLEGNRINMRIYFDLASAELFADGGFVSLTDIYFPNLDFDNLYLYSNDSIKVNALDIYPLKPMTINFDDVN